VKRVLPLTASDVAFIKERIDAVAERLESRLEDHAEASGRSGAAVLSSTLQAFVKQALGAKVHPHDRDWSMLDDPEQPEHWLVTATVYNISGRKAEDTYIVAEYGPELVTGPEQFQECLLDYIWNAHDCDDAVLEHRSLRPGYLQGKTKTMQYNMESTAGRATLRLHYPDQNGKACELKVDVTPPPHKEVDT